MLSRRHLRIKSLQAVYAFSISGNDNLESGEKLLISNFEKLYELYIHQLSLLREVVDFASQRMDEARQKFFPTPEEADPNPKFLNNRFLAKLYENKAYRKYHEVFKINWSLQQELIKKLWLAIKDSEEYQKYLQNDTDTFAKDVDFIAYIIKNHFTDNESIIDYYEDRNIFWPADYDTSIMMMMKTLKHFKASTPDSEPLPGLLDNTDEESRKEDYKFMIELFRKTVIHSEEYENLIDSHLDNWELERIAEMDKMLIKMALCELLEFPSIPVKVTMNEYIEISKYFSTPKSSQFINGILDKLVADLKLQKKIAKRGRGLME